MKNRIFFAGVALAVLTPSVVSAQDDGCRSDRSGRIIGTAVGAGAGGVLGNEIAGRGDKTEGSIIGAVVGAVIGNQVSKSNRGDCRTAYGYYDEQGRWHATGVSANEARGYYDRNNRWVGNTVTGYYDTNGRWVAGPTQGRYDACGRWIVGDTAYANENSANWNAVKQPGYYTTDGRWVAGRAYGYYDSQGRWVSTREGSYQNNDYRSNTQYRPGMGQYDLNQMPMDISSRISWMREYIRDSVQSQQMSRARAQYARRELTAIEVQKRQFNRDGRFTAREEQMIRRRLDRLTTRFEQSERQARNN